MNTTRATSPATVTSPFSARARGMTRSSIREILKVTGMPEIISFAGGLPAPELFPITALRQAADTVLGRSGAASLQYDISEGHWPLRQWICDHLRQAVGLSARPERVLIANGSQQALDLTAKIFVDPGDIVLVENPAYLGALQAFRAYEADVRGLPSDGEGILPEALLDALDGHPKFLYLVTNFQNPTGTSTSGARRKEIAAIASARGLTVVEDDPYGRLRYSGPEAPALVSLPNAGSWLYLGTSSKILSPGLRVGWIVASDDALYERLSLAKQSADLHTSGLTQRMICQFLETPNALQGHLARLRSAYRLRRDAMVAALARHFPSGCTWTMPEGGLFLWVTLPEGTDTAGLLAASLAEKVAFVPGAPFWVGREVGNTLRLNFSNASEERIEEGISRLARVVAAALRP